MALFIFFLVLLGMLYLAKVEMALKLREKAYLINLSFTTEVKQPFNPNLMPKALTIEDLNNLARQFCERGQAIVIQCIERKITNPNAILSPFCQDVINHIQSGDDLTSDVQYLWGYLPNRIGTLNDLYSSDTTDILTAVQDLAPYLRNLWDNQISPTYSSYFWYINLGQYYYHKPEDDRNPTPCAYSGIIIPPN